MTTQHTADGPEPHRHVEVQLEATPDAGARARALLPPICKQLSDVRGRNLQVVVSELVSNAVEHGRGTSVALTLELGEDGQVRGEVADDGPVAQLPHIEQEPDGQGGFGLRLVDVLTDEWGVQENPTHVWFRL